MKLKKLLEGYAWERTPGQPLPSLKDVAKKHNTVNEVDYSTMRLASNIDQKWKDGRNMEDDLVQWFKASVAAGGPEMGEDLILSMDNIVKQMRDYMDDELNISSI
jgi:hypothetical protein|tara:strand:- start:443 stop:757 length:315 start_codon:yes stop_codon:yes gene_type:complete